MGLFNMVSPTGFEPVTCPLAFWPDNIGVSSMIWFAPAVVIAGAGALIETMLGRVDKRDSQGALIVIQSGICDGDQLGTRPDVG